MEFTGPLLSLKPHSYLEGEQEQQCSLCVHRGASHGVPDAKGHPTVLMGPFLLALTLLTCSLTESPSAEKEHTLGGFPRGYIFAWDPPFPLNLAGFYHSFSALLTLVFPQLGDDNAGGLDISLLFLRFLKYL